MRRSLALVALLAAGWTACPDGDLDQVRRLAPTAAACAETDGAWREGPYNADGGASCDTVLGLEHAVAARGREWCAVLAGFRVRCRAAGFPTGGAR